MVAITDSVPGGRFVGRSAVLQAAQQERAQLRLSDRVTTHQLPSEALAALIAQLRAVSGLKRAYLVRKLTTHLPERAMYVLGFSNAQWWRLASRARAKALLQTLREQVSLPGAALIVNLDSSNRRFKKKFRSVRDARII